MGIDDGQATDARGGFLFDGLPPGTYSLEVQHVAYVSRKQAVTLAPGDSVWIEFTVVPRTYVVEEVPVSGPRVVPLSSSKGARYTVPQAVLDEFPLDDLQDALELLPGVTVSGDRPFFRGIGFEHVLPLIDGVPAREPIKGQWILPPPQAVNSAEFLASGFSAQHGPSLAGIMQFRLAEGGESAMARLGYSTDRLEFTGDDAMRTDNLEFSISGPTPLRGLYFSGSWQGHATDTHLSYSHALPDQSILGTISIGDRMRGEQAASARLTYRPKNRTWKLTGSLVHSRDRRKNFHHHYSQTGYVGFNEAFNRYTSYIADPAHADSAVFNDAPLKVPTYERISTLAFVTWDWRWSPQSSLRLHAVFGSHRHRTDVDGFDLTNDEALRNWARNEITGPDFQEDWYFATHGYLSEFEFGESTEGGLGIAAQSRLFGPHDLRIGGGLTGGGHKYATAIQGIGMLGSFDSELDALDGYAYIEDTWYSDKLSSVQLALRYDTRRISLAGESATGSTLAPRLSFHQPMTHRDAIHVQAGLFYQFPALQTHFTSNPFGSPGIDLQAQRTRSYDIGFQHHFSQAVVGYLGAYQREYSDVIFSTRTPNEFEAAFGQRALPPQIVETLGLEAVLDHRIRPDMNGQLSLSLSRTTQNDVEVSWSRRLFLRGWLAWRPRYGMHLSVTGSWSTGQPYTICIKTRGCDDDDQVTGRLPSNFDMDTALRWSEDFRGKQIRLVVEVRNLFDRKDPTFDFGVYPMRIRSANFLAFYHEYGETGGYVVDTGSTGSIATQVNNPQTRTPGRNVRLGVELGF
jgi:hypothetical protein